MGKRGIGLLIVLLYSFPFAYFALYQDFANRTLLGYFIMIAATLLLSFLGARYSRPIFPVIGNVLSAITSYYFINAVSGNERWDSYFKPLSSCQYFILISVLNIIPQLLAMRWADRYRKMSKN